MESAFYPFYDAAKFSTVIYQISYDIMNIRLLVNYFECYVWKDIFYGMR